VLHWPSHGGGCGLSPASRRRTAPQILRIVVSRRGRVLASFRSRACSRSSVDGRDRGCDDVCCTTPSLLAVPLFTQYRYDTDHFDGPVCPGRP
jgi:hypothetical protein